MSRLNSLDDQPVGASLLALIVKTVQIVVLAIPGLVLLPLHLIGSVLCHRPPNSVHFSQVRRYLAMLWSTNPESPPLRTSGKLYLTLCILRRCTTAPVLGCAWLLDELLYRKQLDNVVFKKHCFLISGGRSGSTQMSRYIETDSNVITPNLLQSMAPYLWLWRLLSVTIGKWVSTETLTNKLASVVPPELLERHEFAPFQSDTFDGAIVAGHLNALSLYMGPESARAEMNFAKYAKEDQEHFDSIVFTLIDRLSRKHALFMGADNKIFFIKGHFLNAANTIEQHWPDATILTMVRDPVKRIQSAVNYMRVNPSDPFLGPIPWGWLTAYLVSSETDYCAKEQEWFSGSQGSNNRFVVHFQDFVSDLPGTMSYVYQVCFGKSTLPAHIPVTHSERKRSHYSVDRSLSELGVDTDSLTRKLENYYQWLDNQRKTQADHIHR